MNFAPSGMKPKATWLLIFLRSQGGNQSSEVALKHVLLNEWLVPRQQHFALLGSRAVIWQLFLWLWNVLFQSEESIYIGSY